ncbi:MAG TPA: hypothetical protein VMB18_02490 [Terriglobales bacterium]|nr:hypothetical protein [Terriglobales bacterium]
MSIQRAARFLIVSFFLCGAIPSSFCTDKVHAGDAKVTALSADDFDWREIVPYLFTACSMPGQQGITMVLENFKVLRTYVASEIQAECQPARGRCPAEDDNGEISKRIAEIVQEEIVHRNKNAVVDHKLTRQPFPFSEIAAVESEKRPQAYLMLALSDRSYKAADVQDKYGTPFDTNIFQWYSVFKYRIKNADYTSDAVFEIDPVDGAVIKVAISLKPKKH